MIQINPSVYAGLKEVFRLLEGVPDIITQGRIRQLNDFLKVNEEGVFIADDDVSSFQEVFENLLTSLWRESRHNYHSYFETPQSLRLRHAQSTLEASAKTDGPAANNSHDSQIYEKSTTLKDTAFDANSEYLMVQLVKLLPVVRKELQDPELTLEAVVRTLTLNEEIPRQSESFIDAVRQFDELSQPASGIELREENLSTPDGLVNHVADTHRGPSLTKMLPRLVFSMLADRTNSLLLNMITGKNRLTRAHYYRTAVAYAYASREFSKLEGMEMNEALMEAKGRAEEAFPGVKLSTSTLMNILSGKIQGPVKTLWRSIYALSLYEHSKLLQDIKWNETLTPETLLFRLIPLLPLIREELEDDGLTLGEVVAALIESKTIAPPRERFAQAAAVYDLYNHPMLVRLGDKDYQSPHELANALITIRENLKGFEETPLTYFIKALELMEKLPGDRLAAIQLQAQAYDSAFAQLAKLDLQGDEPLTSARLVHLLTPIIDETVQEFKNRSGEIEISHLNLVRHMVATGSLRGDIRPYLIAAAAADLSHAWKLSGWQAAAENQPLTEEAPSTTASTGTEIPLATPNLDRFAKEVRPFVERAAAHDFVGLFERELVDEDFSSPQTLIAKLDSIRDTLEAYAHEPLTTFISALGVVGKIKDNVQEYLRLAAAHDLTVKFLHEMRDEDFTTPEKLAAKLNRVRSRIEGYENESLVTFVEALAVIGMLPGKPRPFIRAANIYEAMLPPDHVDPEGGSSPASPSGNGAPQTSIKGFTGGGGNHGRGPMHHRLPPAASLPAMGVGHFMTPAMAPFMTGSTINPVFLGAPGLMPMVSPLAMGMGI